MPKLILWEKLLKEELVLLIKLLPGEQQLRRFKQSSGNAILEFGICIMLLQFCALNFFFITIFLVIIGKSMNFGRKGTENWHFLKKYGAVLFSTSHYR